MKKSKKKQMERWPSLVVDTCVAKSAGGVEATALEGKYCRDCLDTILKGKFKVAMSKGIFEEWMKHPSNKAISWLTAMRSSGRVRDIFLPNKSVKTRKEIERESIKSKREAMKKDTILIEAALATDKRIISKDKEARELFHKLSNPAKELREIYWAHVMCPECIEWLKDNACSEKKWDALRLETPLSVA